jgi:hypothetical protein
MLHDIGLLKEFSTPQTPFEIDGANRAENLVRESGGACVEANKVWQAIALHDIHDSIPQHASPEATLVAAGAGADVGGPEENIVSALPVIGTESPFSWATNVNRRQLQLVQNR